MRALIRPSMTVELLPHPIKQKRSGPVFPIWTAFENWIGSSRTEKQIQGVLKNLFEGLQKLRADRSVNHAMIA